MIFHYGISCVDLIQSPFNFLLFVPAQAAAFSGTSLDQLVAAADDNDEPPMEGSNEGEDEDEIVEPPAVRRGRSASMGEAGEGGEIMEADQEGGLSRETSASSDQQQQLQAPATPTREESTEDFVDASLLLGISGTTDSSLPSSGVMTPQLDAIEGKEKREIIDQTTLPTSMTSFLDILTEEERRVRHRHIPGVDGFRKLYKQEVKSDITEARRMKKLKNIREIISREDSDEGDEGAGENDGEGEDEKNSNDEAMTSDSNLNVMITDREERIPDRDAFVVPGKETISRAIDGRLSSLIESTDFETAIDGSGKRSSTQNQQPSPRLVDSLTSFNPPRPQESTASKMRHRLKRWESNPSEVESDLANYRRTVSRTREELRHAEDERERIESVASLMRSHFMNHLMGYRSEMLAIHEQMTKVNGNCLELEERYGGRSLRTRGSSRGVKDVLGTVKELGGEIQGARDSAGNLKDVLGTLKSLGGEIRGVNDGAGSLDESKDWRVEGLGGVSSNNYVTDASGNKAKSTVMASGWFLVGDDVIVSSSGEEGKVVSICGPTGKVGEDDSGDTKKDSDETKKPEGDDAKDDSPNKEKDTADSSKGEEEKPSDGATTAKKEDEHKIGTELAPQIGVKLAKNGAVTYYNSSELEFNPKKLPSLIHSDPLLAKRWQDMVATALANGIDHDLLAMGEYIDSSFAKEEELTAADDQDGGSSPKSVTKYDDERGLLPFGSDLFASPDAIKNFPSVIPSDTLEEKVRGFVYEAKGPRVVPTMSSDVKKFEAQQEEMNELRGKVMQLRNCLGRQKRLRSLNERSLHAGRHRAHKVEGLLLEMQMDLKNLKGRLQDELNELGKRISCIL